MRARILAGTLSALSMQLAAATGQQAASTSASSVMKAPLSFIQNQGQVKGDAKFLVSGPAGNLALTENRFDLAVPYASGEPARIDADRVEMRFAGANPHPQVVGEARQSGSTNYFRGTDPSKWLKDVPTYAKVRYQGVYPGTDLLCYGADGKLEYDWVVQPGSDPSRITLAFDGVASLKVDAKGDLVARTAHGEVRQAPPVAYQMVDGQRREVIARFKIGKGHSVGFTLGAYDASRELVIDPQLSWTHTLETASPVVGGGIYGINNGQGGVAVAPNGDVIFAWSDYKEFSAGVETGGIRVMRIAADNSGVVYNSTFGGSTGATDTVNGVAVDGSGNAYVTGYTNDASFPTTSGSMNGYTPYVLKVGTTGATAYGSLFDGGVSNQAGSLVAGIAVDASGNAFVCGSDSTGTFAATGGAAQTSHYNDSVKNGEAGGSGLGDDAWVVKLNASGVLTAATYLGGDDFDEANGIAVDSIGNVFVTGQTFSSTGLTTGGSYQSTHGNDLVDLGGGIFLNDYDGFVAKLNNSLTSKTWCSYLGGSGADESFAVTTDAGGNVYVALETFSTDLPHSAGAHQTSHANDGPGDDVYIAKLDSAGTTLQLGTYFGGVGADLVDHIAVDAYGTVYFTGTTTSSDFPSVHQLYAYDTTNGSPYLAKLSADGTVVTEGTSLNNGASGPLPDGSNLVLGLAVNSTGDVYVAGVQNSAPSYIVGAKILNEAPTLNPATLPGVIQQGSSATVSFADLQTATAPSDGDSDPITFVVQNVSDGTLTKNGNPVVPGATTLASGESLVWTPAPADHGNPLYAFTLSDSDGFHVSSPAQIRAHVNAQPTVSAISTQDTGSAGTPVVVPFTVGDSETAAGSLNISVNSTNTTLLPNANISFTNTSGSCSLTATPVAGLLGSSTVTITVTDADGGIGSTSFDLRALDTIPPTQNHTVSGSTGVVTFTANATDSGSGVSRVGFWIDGKSQITSYTPPYAITFNTATLLDGTHTFRTNAIDQAGNVDSVTTTFTTSNGVHDTTPPVASCSVTGNTGTILLAATVTDDWGVSRVGFFIDGVGIKTWYSNPYQFTFDSTLLSNGTHTLRVDAHDTSGNVSSSSVSFTVTN